MTRRLKGLARSNVRVRITNELFGVDPDPGPRKILIVTYSFSNGPAQEVRVSERDTLLLP